MRHTRSPNCGKARVRCAAWRETIDKHASQDRSRATVDALVEATARILVREGFDKASTNHIAAKAGVSVGSLYQYFPSKEALVAVAIQAHRIDPKLHRVLAEQIPRTGKLENIETFNRENYALFRTYLEAHRHELRPVDLELAAFVCVTSIEALTHTAVLHHSDSFSDEAFAALVDEATRLVVRYLQ